MPPKSSKTKREVEFEADVDRALSAFRSLVMSVYLKTQSDWLPPPGPETESIAAPARTPKKVSRKRVGKREVKRRGKGS